MRVALISLDQKWEDKSHNMHRCNELAAKAADFGSDLIIFPEMTLTGFTMNIHLSAEDPKNSPSLAAFGRLAMDNRVSIIAGMVMRCGVKASNMLVAFSSNGQEQASYAKMHPFTFAGENNFFEPGRELAKMQMPEFKLGLSICYDLRFPELYSALAKDCEVLVNIANWPKKRVSHWRALLQARAIENQIYMIGVNRIGVDGNSMEYVPSSAVVDANGDFITPVVADGELAVYELNRQVLLDFRAGFSTRQDRLPDLYRHLI